MAVELSALEEWGGEVGGRGQKHCAHSRIAEFKRVSDSEKSQKFKLFSVHPFLGLSHFGSHLHNRKNAMKAIN